MAVFTKRTGRIGSGSVVSISPRPRAGFSGVFMSLHFAVISDFSFLGCQPSLTGLCLYSTKEACTPWPVPGSVVRFFCNKQVFPTLKQARFYIAYLKERYRNSPVPFPVLDKGQKELFQEVTE
jgi:hypothetical protein